MIDFRTPSNAVVDCIESCTACEHLCIETIAHCQEKRGRLAEPDRLALLGVCADICGTSARAMLSGSDAHVHTCTACAEICRRGAESCGLHAEDARLRACASACANAARCCAEMAHMPATQFSRLLRHAS